MGGAQTDLTDGSTEWVDPSPRLKQVNYSGINISGGNIYI